MGKGLPQGASDDLILGRPHPSFAFESHQNFKWEYIGGMNGEIGRRILNFEFLFSGNKAFFDVNWSPLNNSIITASADRHIRLYDPRSTGNLFSKLNIVSVVYKPFSLLLVSH